MADIIQLDAKLQHSKEKKADIIKKRKVLAIQKVFQCTHCAFKCEKCGIQITLDEENKTSDSRQLKVPYRFCASCSEEYIDYIKRLQGEGDEDCYWHNEAWLEVWKKWIDYQHVIDRYLKSKEFLMLMQEMKDTGPDQ